MSSPSDADVIELIQRVGSSGDTIEIAMESSSVEVYETTSHLVSHAEQGPRGVPGKKGDPGEKGDPGPAAFVSADANNMTREGTDGGLFTPDLVSDPLAYYILAKS